MTVVRSILAGKGADIFSVSPDTTLEAAARELTARRIGAVVVMEKDHLAGILSERDIVRAIAREGGAALGRPVASVMTQKVEVCGLDDLIDDLSARMTDRRIRHLPVQDGGRIVGVISIGDVVKARIEEVVRETDHMRAYIHQTG
jgi:CBS domain-containing protein